MEDKKTHSSEFTNATSNYSDVLTSAIIFLVFVLLSI